VNSPVLCSGCIVHPGDIVIADDDGVLVVPAEHIAAAVEQVRKRVLVEADLHRRIKAGERLFETQNFGAVLEENGIEIEDGHWRSG
jgi:4-hydroxy-4-methyl-2-oxoglutarate aldolase